MKHIIRIVLTLALIAILGSAGCEKSTDSSESRSIYIDIIIPGNNAIVPAGIVPIEAVAIARDGVDDVRFYINDVLIGSALPTNGDTVYYSWDASTELDGSSHVIKARLYDKASHVDSCHITIHIETGSSGGTHHDNDITVNEVWSAAQNPHYIDNLITIYDGASLQILEACSVYVAQYCGIVVDSGDLTISGDTLAPVLLTSAEASPAPGDWKGIQGISSQGNIFLYGCIIEYAGFQNWYGSVYLEDGKDLNMMDCTIRNSGGNGLVVTAGARIGTFRRNTITSCNSYPVIVNPTSVMPLVENNSFSGNAIDEVGIFEGELKYSLTWPKLDQPYNVQGLIYAGSFESHAVLTIQAGTTLRMGAASGIIVGGNGAGGLIANGTAGQVIFTSDQSVPSAGDWKGISFYDYAYSDSCLLKGCKIEYGGGASNGIIACSNAAPVIMEDSIGHSASWGVYLEGVQIPDSTLLEAENTFYDCANGNVSSP